MFSLNQNWSKPDRDILAPNVVAVIKRFNLVSTWVATEIVKAEKMKDRVQLIKNFVRIAQVLYPRKIITLGVQKSFQLQCNYGDFVRTTEFSHLPAQKNVGGTLTPEELLSL